jgi:hypothetical protein
MNSFNPLFISMIGLMGCAQTDCTEPACADTRDIELADGFEAARTVLEGEGIRLPKETEILVRDEIDPDLRERCELTAVMAVRWSFNPNDFDGLIISSDGEALADVDGRFAPARPDLGAFAGGYTVISPDQDDGDRKGNFEPTNERMDGTIGGAYTGDHRFAGAISRGENPLLVRGVWIASHQGGGYAVGAVLSCEAVESDPDVKAQR